MAAALLATLLLLGQDSGAESTLEQSLVRGDTRATLKIRGLRQIVRGEAPSASMRLAGVLEVELAVEGPIGLQVEPEPSLFASAGWQALETGAVTAIVKEGRLNWNKLYRIAPTQPGALSLQLAPLRFREGTSAEWATFTWLPITVSVEVRGTPDGAGVHGPFVPELTESQTNGLGAFELGALLLVLAVCVAIVVVRIHRWRGRRSLSPERWLQRELSELDRKLSVGQLERAAYLAALAERVRGYCDRRLGIRATSQTTSELLQEFERKTNPEPRLLEELRNLLAISDRIKFALADASANACESARECAQAIGRMQTGVDVKPRSWLAKAWPQ